MGVMATSTYGNCCPGSRRVGMMLCNLSALEVRIPPRTVISNVQAIKIIPNLMAANYMGEVFPSMKQTELSMGQPAYLLNFP